MKRLKLLGLSLFLAISSLLISFAPAKAQDWSNSNFDSNDMMFSSNQWDPSFNFNPVFRDRSFNRFRINRAVTFPRTVYLVDASNSANQVNIINATTGGTTNAARIIVSPQAYSRVINDLDTISIMSVRVDQINGLVTFSSPVDTFTSPIIAISFL